MYVFCYYHFLQPSLSLFSFLRDMMDWFFKETVSWDFRILLFPRIMYSHWWSPWISFEFCDEVAGIATKLEQISCYDTMLMIILMLNFNYYLVLHSFKHSLSTLKYHSWVLVFFQSSPSIFLSHDLQYYFINILNVNLSHKIVSTVFFQLCPHF